MVSDWLLELMDRLGRAGQSIWCVLARVDRGGVGEVFCREGQRKEDVIIVYVEIST